MQTTGATPGLFPNAPFFVNPFTVQPIQAKLNRIIRNSLLSCSPIDETGKLDEPTLSALKRLRDTYALDNSCPFSPGVVTTPYKRNLEPALNWTPAFSLPRKYDPLTDFAPDTRAMQLLQWLVDHSSGPLSQMTPKAHVELAKAMLGHGAAVPTNTPYLVNALIDANRQFGKNMDHTDWLIMTLATVAAEVGGSFIPTDEGVDRNSIYNNTAYENFDVYEPLTETEVQKRITEAMKNPSYRKPHREPGAASDGNTQPGDGARFKGRGLVQLTHRENYAKADRALSLGLLDHPEKGNSIEVSAKVMVWFLSKGGVFGSIGKVQAALGANDTLVLREAVNGVARHGKLPAGIENFRKAYWAGKCFMFQAYNLRTGRLGLRPVQPLGAKVWQ